MITTKGYLQTGAAQESPVIRITTKYMETLQKVQPVLGGGGIAPFLNVDERLDLYTSGTDDFVFRLHPSSDVYAPYESNRLGIQASQLSLFLPLQGDSNNPSILGLDVNSRLTLSTYSKIGGYKQILFEPAKETERKIMSFASVRGATGNIYVTAILEDNTLVNNFFSPADLKWKSERWVPVNDPDGKTAKVRELTTVINDPVQSSLFGIGLAGTPYDGRVLFSEAKFAFSSMVDLKAPIINKKWGKVAHIAVIKDKNDLLNIFGIESETGTLWLKKQKKPLVTGKIEFEDWKSIADTSSNFNLFGAKLKTLQGNLRFDGLIELYCTGDDNALYYTHLQEDGISWSTLFPLGTQFNVANFVVARNITGYSEVYSVSTDNKIIRYVQSPETTQWFTYPVYIEDTRNEIVTVPGHSVDLTVLDEKGVPQPLTEVSLSTSYQTQLSINGLSYGANAVDTFKVKTDASGKLSIIQHASGLAGATLFVETPFTGTGEPVAIEPNLQLLGKIQTTTANDVLNAKDRQGNYLLSEKDRTQANAESIAAIMQSSSSLCDTGQLNPVVYFYHHRGRPAQANTSRLNIQANVGKNWEIDFSSGFPVYKQLDSVASLRYTNMTDLGGIFGIEWSDVWNAIKGGVNKVIDGIKKVVVVIADAVQVFFDIVINGITQTFKAIVETVQQVFNFVEGVWNWLKVTAQKLYEWLAFFFAWDDIKRTAQVVEYSTNVFLDFMTAAVEHIRSEAANWIDGLKDSLKQSVDEYLAKYGNNTTLGTIGDEYKQPIPQQESAMDHNPLLSSYKENYKGTTVKDTFAQKLADSPITDLIDKLLKLADDFMNGDGKQAFQEAITYFSNIKDNPDRALELLFSGLVKVGESIALYALDLGKALILFMLDIIIAIIDAFKTIMNEEWEIPIVSDIYKYITGDTLAFRPIQLLSYVVAIPATLIYKIMKNEAPFADDAAVRAFEDYYTLEYIERRAGIGPFANARARKVSKAIDQAQESVARTLFKAGYAVSMFVATFADITTAVLASTEVVSSTVGYVSTGAGILAAVFTNPWILDVDPGKLFCSDKQSSGGSSFKLGYIASAITLIKGGAVALYKKLNPTTPDPMLVKINEISSTIAGGLQVIIYVVEFIITPNADGKVFARTLTATIPGKTLRFLSLAELNTGTYFIPVGILSVLTFSGYTASYVINFTISEQDAVATKRVARTAEIESV